MPITFDEGIFRKIIF